jgi:pimeloyl-ACP methyl ester carboxylesterase
MERRRFVSSGGTVSYTDVGSGPAVVLLHGFPANALQWRYLAPLLATRFRVIVPDLLGAGASDKPEEAQLGIEAQAGYVRELLEDLGVERVAVIGHGAGGGIAQLLALDDAGVDALVLIDAVAFDAWPSVILHEIQRSADDASVALRRLLDGLPAEVVDAYAAPYEADPVAFRRSAAALDGRGLTGRDDAFGEIGFPVLILWGEDDPVHPVADAERLNEAIPSSTLGLLPGCGHHLIDEAPATVGPLIMEYLRAMYLRAPHGHDAGKEGVVMLQLERRPPWIDLAEDEADDWFDVDDDGWEGPT